MYISELTLVNYRNFKNSKFIFKKGINTIIGENASGKSNVFRAIRLLLDNSMSRSAYKLSENDFCRERGDWRGHWIIISITFDDISDDEVSQSLFIHGLGNQDDEVVTKATCNLIFRPKAKVLHALSEIDLFDTDNRFNEIRDSISISDYETIVTGRSNVDFSDEREYSRIVGDFDFHQFPDKFSYADTGTPLSRFLNLPNEVSFTFVKALRDVVSDFQNNRTNPLLTLLRSKSGKINKEEFDPVAKAVDALNIKIENLSDVEIIRNDIKRTINSAAGDTYSPDSLSVKSSLSNEADDLFRSLKLFIDESGCGHEDQISEMSLGGANLIYLTLKLLEFKYQHENKYIANFLLIEEPEAHIHTHIQKTLFDKINYENTQIIYSTHSSHISEVCKIRNINILGRVNGNCAVFQPSTGLSEPQITYIQRYLDAIRSNLLFAKSVILVEGDAEEILLPVMIKKVLGLSLDEIGISLINIRSTGFENIALLFHDDRIRKKCSIITDLDSCFYDTTPYDNDSDSDKKKKIKALGSQNSGAQRKVNLDKLCQNNDWLSVFYAKHTFEVDLISSGNSSFFKSIVNDIYTDPKTREKAMEELTSSDISIQGQRALAMAAYKKKGWFALTLSEEINYNAILPKYIVDAIIFSHGSFDPQKLIKIIDHQFYEIKEAVKKIKCDFLENQLETPPEKKVYYESRITEIEESINCFEDIRKNVSSEIKDIQSLKEDFMTILKRPKESILRYL